MPDCTIRPPSSTAIRWPKTTASRGLWVTKTVVHGSEGEHRAQVTPHPGPGLNVESRERLIQQQEPGLEDHRARQGDPLLLATRQSCHAAGGEVGHAKLLQRLLAAFKDFLFRSPASPQAEGHVLEHVQVGQQCIVLRKPPDLSFLGWEIDLPRGIETRRFPQDDPARSRPGQPCQKAEDRGLPRAALSHQHESLARRDLELEIEREGTVPDGELCL